MENLKFLKSVSTRSIIIESEVNKYDFLIANFASGLTIEIREIQVNSNRRKGVGRALIKELENQFKSTNFRKVWALTREENKIAHNFYKALGFKQSELLKDFYPDGSAYIFWKGI